MQKLMGLVRRCVDDYHMIEAGDRIAVGVSGGKDSLVLLVLLAGLKQYFNKPFELEAITIDMGLGMDYSPIAALCEELNVPYTIISTEIAPIIFDHRKEKNPCYMCSKMRRGALNQAILDKGFNKLALGHHYDDAVETFVMNLLFEGRIGCFQPVTNLDRTGIIQIRPMLHRVQAGGCRGFHGTGAIGVSRHRHTLFMGNMDQLLDFRRVLPRFRQHAEPVKIHKAGDHELDIVRPLGLLPFHQLGIFFYIIIL